MMGDDTDNDSGGDALRVAAGTATQAAGIATWAAGGLLPVRLLRAENKCCQWKAGNFKDSMKFPSSCTIASVGSGIWSTMAQAAQGSPGVAAWMPATPCCAAGHASC